MERTAKLSLVLYVYAFDVFTSRTDRRFLLRELDISGRRYIPDLYVVPGMV